jgi:hypothetical protein
MQADDEQLPTIRDDINQTSVELLLTDSNVALTFLSIAETTENRETAERNIHNAHKAYDSIQNFRLRYVFTDAQTATLNSNLGEVKARLEALGRTF